MLEHDSRIRKDAEREALDAMAEPSRPASLEAGVHQDGHPFEEGDTGQQGKLLD